MDYGTLGFVDFNSGKNLLRAIAFNGIPHEVNHFKKPNKATDDNRIVTM